MKNTLLALLVFLVPTSTWAHTKWFAHESLMPYTTSEPTTLYLIIWTAIIAAVVAVGAWCEKNRCFQFAGLEPHQKPHSFERAASTFVMVAGAFFIIAGTHEYLFSPNLTVESGMPMYLVAIEILVGLAFLLGIASRVAGITLALSWVAAFFYTSSILVIEDIWVVSTAVFVIFMGNDYFSIFTSSRVRSIMAPFKHYSLSLLRIGTGLTLMVLGLSEKILAPEYGVNFLHIHQWNFMQHLGFDFSHYLFTISAGATEFLLGLIFVLGIMTRINAAVVIVVFSIPMFLLGPTELAGHLPHLAAVVLLLLFGNGGHFALFSDKKYH